MKIALRAALISTALVSVVSVAQAQTVTEYASVAPINGSPTTYNATTPAQVADAEAVLALGGTELGTRYTASSTSFADSTETRQVVDVVFTLNGTVNKDCSFYAGNNDSARTINFGTIGVRTGDNENVGAAFEMVGAANANVETLTAGCNTNNVVEISKDDIRGLVNNNPGGYDTDQFQANIPYSVKAEWTGVAQSAQAVGSAQSLNVPTTGNAGQLGQGAWRSKMNINFNAPVISSKALVAGEYTGKTTLTLRAI